MESNSVDKNKPVPEVPNVTNSYSAGDNVKMTESTEPQAK